MPKTEGVVFRHAVESFIAYVLKRNALLTPDFVAELKASGFDPEKPRDTEADVWISTLRKTATRLSPDADEDAALERVGREMLRGMFETLIGRGMLMVMKLLGVRKSLLRIAEQYNTSDTITRVVTEEVSPTHVRITFNTVRGVPTYVRGLVLEAMQTQGAKDVSITFLNRADGGTVYDVKWAG